MEDVLEPFYRAARDTLKAQPGPTGRAALVKLLEIAVNDPAFKLACFEAGKPGRHQLYQDPELGFCVLAYDMDEARLSPPHDHGSSWAIYVQAESHTDMTEYRREDGGTGPGPAKLSETRSYRLEPGQGALFDVGTIHRIDYPAGSRFVRISGADMETVPRIKYDLEAGEAIEMAGVAVPD